MARNRSSSRDNRSSSSSRDNRSSASSKDNRSSSSSKDNRSSASSRDNRSSSSSRGNRSSSSSRDNRSSSSSRDNRSSSSSKDSRSSSSSRDNRSSSSSRDNRSSSSLRDNRSSSSSRDNRSSSSSRDNRSSSSSKDSRFSSSSRDNRSSSSSRDNRSSASLRDNRSSSSSKDNRSSSSSRDNRSSRDNHSSSSSKDNRSSSSSKDNRSSSSSRDNRSSGFSKDKRSSSSSRDNRSVSSQKENGSLSSSKDSRSVNRFGSISHKRHNTQNNSSPHSSIVLDKMVKAATSFANNAKQNRTPNVNGAMSNVANQAKQTALKVAAATTQKQKNRANSAIVMEKMGNSATSFANNAKQNSITSASDIVRNTTNKVVKSTLEFTKTTSIPSIRINLSEQELRGLAKQASYVNFVDDKRNFINSDEFNKNLKDELKSEYNLKRFLNNFNVLDQMPNTSTGASALLLRDKNSGKAIIAIRGTERSISDYLTDIRLGIKGRPAGQEIDIFNYYQELSTPKGEPVVEAQYAKKRTISGGLIPDTSRIITSTNPNKKGKGLISKSEAIDTIGHSLGGTLANGLHYSIPNPSASYAANGAGLRLNETNKKVYEQLLAISSNSKQKIDWKNKNKLVTNTVTTGFPSFTASNTPVLPQNGTVVKLPQSIDGFRGHFIAQFNDSRILSHIVQDIGSDYAELTTKYTKTTISNRVNKNVRGLVDKTYQLNTKVDYEKMLLNNMAEFLENPKRYVEGNEENNRQLLMEIREKLPQLDNNQKRRLNEYLNNPNNIKRQDSIGSSGSNGVNMRNHRQYENLIQAMSQVSKQSSSTSIQANNIIGIESALAVNSLV